MLVALAIGLLGSLWIFQEYVNFNRQAEAMRAVQLKSRKAELKKQVDNVVDCIRIRRSQTEDMLRADIKSRVFEAHALASHIYSTYKDKKSSEEMQSMVREALRSLRFHDGK
ncbi:MAG: cache domain-containing protein, partial [Desulfobulbaceae bacterium]|nr:cache domain-containing protein [Desulfobulbaceae bacterium]